MPYKQWLEKILKKKKLITTFLCFLLSMAFTANAFAGGPSVMDIKASSLNIRSGPGLGYYVICVQPNDADLPQYTADYPNDLAPIDADGYNWLKCYYPDASFGRYSGNAVGWAAWYPDNNMSDRYMNYAYNCKVISSSSIYLYQDTNLTNPYPGTYSYGTYLACYGPDYYLESEAYYPNAWRISRPNAQVGESSLSYGNGWKLNAAPDN